MLTAGLKEAAAALPRVDAIGGSTAGVLVDKKLGLASLLRAVKERSCVPVGAYCVSGEYSMIKAAAERGWLDERRVAAESAICLARGGADIIVSYFAPELARMMKEGEL